MGRGPHYQMLKRAYGLAPAIASETPAFVGRAIAALASDPDHRRLSGQALRSWGLSDIYDFTDADGARPHWGRYFAAAFPKE